MNIWDSRKTNSTIVIEDGGTTLLSADKDSLVVSNEEDQLVVADPKCTEVVSLGDGQYLRGPKGDKGDTPDHEWVDTSLRFRRPDGSWGWLVDLQGEKGDKGDQGIQGPAGIGVEGPQGNDGITRYAWVKYADTTTPAPEEMFQSPDGRIYFGIAYNKLLDEGEGDPLEFDHTQYKWSKILGEDGIPGTPGNTGPVGPAGVGFTWIGEFPQHPTELDIGRPIEDGDTYFNTSDNKVYTYAGGWHTMLESGGEGPIGPQGSPGGGFQYQGEFTSSPSGALVNWLYKNINNDLFYMYDGTSWILATSDGKDSPDGAPAGNGLSFFTTYHDSVTQPARPTLDGDTNGWNPNAHTFDPGTIKWVSQKIATEPELGAWNDPIDISTHEYRGPVGFRGSQSIMIPIPGWNGNWDDALAATAVSGAAPQEWDVVTMYKSEDPALQETRRWAYNPQNGIWEWLAYNYVFLGDVLVDGTLDAQKVNVNSTLTVGTGDNVAKVSGEDTIRIAAGNADKSLAPFRVYQDGSIVAENATIEGTVVATSGSFTGDVFAESLTLSGAGTQIQSAVYTPGDVGWSINNDGTAEFNDVTVRGTGYFTDGIFDGTVYAENLEGGVTSTYIKAQNRFTSVVNSGTWLDVSEISILNTYTFDRYLSIEDAIGGVIRIQVQSGASGGTNYEWRLYSPSLNKTYATLSSTATFPSGTPPLRVTISVAKINISIPANETPGDIILQWRSTSANNLTVYSNRTFEGDLDDNNLFILLKDSTEMA